MGKRARILPDYIEKVHFFLASVFKGGSLIVAYPEMQGKLVSSRNFRLGEDRMGKRARIIPDYIEKVDYSMIVYIYLSFALPPPPAVLSALPFT